MAEFTQVNERIKRALDRFPRFFDETLLKGFQKLTANSSSEFLSSRTPSHISKLLFTQFFLQKKIELALQEENQVPPPLFLKLYPSSGRICIAATGIDSLSVRHDQLLKTLQSLLPGIQEVPGSFYFWLSPDHPYFFCYLEVRKLRGEELPSKALKKLQIRLKEQLQLKIPLTATLFWPYNEEESFKQVQHLLKEIETPQDLPQISIQFQEQTASSLEFLIHLARPKCSGPLHTVLEKLPSHLDFFCHFEHVAHHSFPVELAAFALKVPSETFEIRDSINLLYARRYIIKFLESVLGPCRDYNGGLFEQQQQHFEVLRAHLSDKIPLFDYFAEKLFYTLRPVENRLMITLDQAEQLFDAFSKTIRGKSFDAANVVVLKETDSSKLPRISHLDHGLKRQLTFTQISFGKYHFHCVLSNSSASAKSLTHIGSRTQIPLKTFRFNLVEGAPTSLNPYHSSSDMRCRILSKLLFEGLFRLNEDQQPELAGALAYQVNEEGTVYQFKLRLHRWSNGEIVTAMDYANSLKSALKGYLSHPEIYYVIKNAENFNKKKAASGAIGIKALDVTTLQIELEYPDPKFLSRLAQPFFFPLFGSHQEPKWFNGPYLVHERRSDSISIKRNPYFWDTKGQFFESMEISWTHDLQKSFALFRENKIDWIGDPLGNLKPEMQEELQSQGRLQKATTQRDYLLFFKTTHPILSSAKIRRALSLSIDRQKLCDTSCPGSIAHFPEKPLYEEANHLFAEGLEELNLSKSDFPALTFNYARRSKLALCLQAVWKQVLDITVHVQKVEWNTFRHQVEKGQFDLCGIVLERIDETSPWHYGRYEGKTSWNFSKWTYAPYRDKIEKAKALPEGGRGGEGEEERRKALLAIGEMLKEQCPFTPLFSYTHLFAHKEGLKGYLLDHRGCVDFSRVHY
jgi:ABC-type oligopeptide transport system substrate-binding subunit